MEVLHEKYQEFKELYLQEFGVELNNEEAENIGERLLKLARAIQRRKKDKDGNKNNI